MRIKRVLILGGGALPHELLHKWQGEVWGINSQTLPAFGAPFRSRMFDLHHYHILKRDGWDFTREIYFAKEYPDVPLYVLEKWPLRVGRQIIFPGKKLMRAFPRGKYHCGSFDWLVTFAISEGFKEIILNGIGLSLADGGEPLSARACLEYWCGIAEGRGIKVQAIHSHLFSWQHIVKTDQIYSYDDVTVFEDRTK